MTGQRYGFLFHWTAQHYWRAQRTGGAPQPSASKSRGGSKVISKVVLQSSPRFSPGGDGLAVHILAPRLSPLPARGWEELGVSPLCLTEAPRLLPRPVGELKALSPIAEFGCSVSSGPWSPHPHRSRELQRSGDGGAMRVPGEVPASGLQNRCHCRHKPCAAKPSTSCPLVSSRPGAQPWGQS